MKNTYAIELFGIIQGVGFRPFVYRLAHTMGLKGYVQNQYDRLFILLEVGTKEQLDAFVAHILSSPPPNARIVKHIITPISQKQSLSDVFEIRESHANKTFVPILLPQDMRICESCLADIRTQGRFYRYAFTTCTDCGARYSIINALPYDRIHTTMRDFALCAKCEADYRNSLNRRFHAQPISCNTCAIQLMLFDSQGTQISADSINDYEMIRAVASAIKAGKIVAIKGVGGFNLITDANNKEAIATLRKRKNRPHKPFAVMFKSISDIESLSDISAQEQESLLSPQAPIVLLERHCRAGGVIDERALDIIAPHLKTLGAILPYNGIMHLLFDELESPIIFTSANLSGEPIIAKTRELIEKLCKRNAIADLVLSYNRAIHNPSDDSIVRLMAGEMRILRLARGYAPLDLLYTHSGAQDLESHEAGDSTKYMDSNITESHTLVVGVGAQQKSSICFLNRHRANISPYIGDLESVDSIMRYESVSAFFNTLYKQTPQIVVCDLHPHYVSTQKARSLKASCYALAHHKAHFYAILGEARALDKNALGIIWDGTGLGEDRRIWGGECFLYEADSYAGSMRRLWHFDEYALLGGEGAIKDIGKIALSLLIHYDLFTSPQAQDILHRHFSSEELGLLQGAYRSRTYPLTSSVGRIFDAVGFLLGLLQIQTYEGQSGALIESCALEYVRDKTMPKPYAFSLENGCVCLKGIIESILTDKEAREKKACRFLETLAHIALTLAKEGIEEAQAPLQVYFSGGVFQNKFLCDRIHTLFNAHKIPFFMHTQLPCNDSNISFGQAVFGTLESKRSKNAGNSAYARDERLHNNPNLNTKSVQIAQKILSKNDKKAAELRAQYADLGVYVINLMSSPGSGKTTLLESLSAFGDFRFAVLEGDLQTNRDAARLQDKGVSAYQITTGEACHLEASMIESALCELQKQCDITQMDYLFIENVGNLVCPASYDLGAALNLVLLSTPEGDDKVLKYPTMFMCADAVIISKADIMEHFQFSIERVKADLARLKADMPLFLTSSKDKGSIEVLRDFIVQKRAQNYQSQHQF